MGQARLTHEEILTALLKVEVILNSCPPTYTTSDDTEEPLTSSHLLLGQRILSFPDDLSYYENADEYFGIATEHLQRRVKYLNHVVNHFWHHWSQEYLIKLQDSQRHQAMSKEASPISIGDVILVHDEGKPQGFLEFS